MLLIQNIGVSYEIVNLYKTINPPVTTYQGNSRQLPVLSYRNHVAYPTVLLPVYLLPSDFPTLSASQRKRRLLLPDETIYRALHLERT